VLGYVGLVSKGKLNGGRLSKPIPPRGSQRPLEREEYPRRELEARISGAVGIGTLGSTVAPVVMLPKLRRFYRIVNILYIHIFLEVTYSSS
jgi:hypothetical protein